MKKKQKIISFIKLFLIVIFIIICTILIFYFRKEPKEIINPNIELSENQEIIIQNNIRGTKIQNVEIIAESEFECQVKAEIINETDSILEAHTIRIIATNNEGLNEIFAGNISSISSGESGKILGIIRKDISSATNIEFELID